MFIELSKVRKRLDIDPKALSRLEQWLVFLAADSDEILEELRMEAHEPELDQALSEIEYAALSTRDQLLYQARMDAIRDQESLLIDRERRGKAELVLKIAKARFGALSEILEESILSLPLELMFIELSKVRKRLDIDPRAMTRLEQWLVFLAADSDEILEELRMEAHEPELDQALSEIEYAALSKRDQLLYQARMDAIRDHDSLLIDRQRRGKAKGKAEMPLKIAISLLRDPAKDTKSGRQENRLETPSSLRRLRGGASMLT